ncbi:hypothetical protein A6R68_03675, partial [Neotoma lepida]
VFPVRVVQQLGLSPDEAAHENKRKPAVAVAMQKTQQHPSSEGSCRQDAMGGSSMHLKQARDLERERAAANEQLTRAILRERISSEEERSKAKHL